MCCSVGATVSDVLTCFYIIGKGFTNIFFNLHTFVCFERLYANWYYNQGAIRSNVYI